MHNKGSKIATGIDKSCIFIYGMFHTPCLNLSFYTEKKAAILNCERLSINVGLGRKTESAIT